MRRLFRFKRKEDETLQGYYTRTASVARTMWKKLRLPFLTEMIVESMQRATGWNCDTRPSAVFTTLKYAFAWRSTASWQSTRASNMMVDPNNHTRWKHKCGWHNRAAYGTRSHQSGLYAKNRASKEEGLRMQWTEETS